MKTFSRSLVTDGESGKVHRESKVILNISTLRNPLELVFKYSHRKKRHWITYDKEGHLDEINKAREK
jgi:hypothetical protein